MSDPVPAAELAALAHALRRHVRRRAGLGERRAARTVPAPVRPVAPPADVPPAPPAPPTGEAPAGSAASAPWPAGWGTTPERKDESEERARAIRERAAAAADLDALRAEVAGCNACSLCRTRTQTVFQAGRGPARVMFVGEAPGFHEDRQGVPFVGPAGKLLTDIVEKGMRLARSAVVIANVLKCRPPDNRDPLPVEKRICTGWLDRQIELVDPEVLIALGRHAAGHLLASDASIERLRGRVWERAGRKVVVTYHPAYLLRTPGQKKECWKDIQLAMAELGLPPRNSPGGAR